MTSENLNEPEEILRIIRKDIEGKFGIICLNCLIARSRFSEIHDFMNHHGIQIPEGQNISKMDLLDHISIFFYEQFQKNPALKKQFKIPIVYIGEYITNDEMIGDYLKRFDFISKRELINAFSDYCADFGISVYSTEDMANYTLDLYLIKKKPFLRTEAVFIRTGEEMTEENYKNIFYLINEASKYAVWTVFVTTPRGVCKIGLERLKKDMENLNTWLYVVDPIHQKIRGIVKGKKSKIHDISSRDEFIKKLPREPIRTPSQIVSLSQYYFKESESYNPKNFVMYDFFRKEELVLEAHAVAIKPKFKEIFKNLLVIDKESGLNILSHSSEGISMEKELISGFLSAMDSFVSEIGGTASMNEISYKGFYIHAAYGQFVKIALFLSKPANQSLKERLMYFLNQFEEHYHDQILQFNKTGNTAVFNKERIDEMIKEILSI
ncbi:MAG: hypothetical protein ACFE9R_20605 [Candidatus Hermodarchaeota archaeon]